MIRVSLFKSFNRVECDKPVEDVLQAIKDGAHREEVNLLRGWLQEGNKKEFEQAKKRLPAFTPSGTFLGGRKNHHLASYSSLIVLDLDKLSTAQLQDVKKIACTSPYTYAAFVSPSGEGIKLFVKVMSEAEEHKLAYQQVKAYYEVLLGVKVDESGSDVTRLCFVSWDEELYENEAAARFNVTVFPKGKAESDGVGPKAAQPTAQQAFNSFTNKRANSRPNSDATPDTAMIYIHCVSLTERKQSFLEGNRNNFVHQLACNLNRYGVGQEDALALILTDYCYDEQEVRTTISSAYHNVQEHAVNKLSPTVHQQRPTREPTVHQQKPTREPTVDQQRPTREPTIITSAINNMKSNPEGENPWNNEHLSTSAKDEDGSPAAFIDKVEDFLMERYEFRYNIVTSRQEYRGENHRKWRLLDDRSESSMLRELQKGHLRVSNAMLRSLLTSDFCPIFDPFQDYFDNLPEWNGEVDYIAELASTVTTTDSEQWLFCFKRWFVAMVAGVLDKRTVNHTLIVLSGGQGLGKTTWVQNLVPKQLKHYIFTGEINPKNKDTLQQLSENMLINLDELENLNRSEIGALKEIVTKSEIKVRKAYGHHHEKMPRRASFAGSVNTAQFLNDTTGSRRFLCFEVLDIDYKHQIDLSLVYAQAFSLFKGGFRFWFDREEIKQITNSNERFQVRSVEEELLLTWFELPAETDPSAFLTSTQIVAKLAANAKINVTDASVNKLGKALKKHGYERLKRGGVYGYLVRELNWDEVERKSQQM